jgi:hypothetical protein
MVKELKESPVSFRWVASVQVLFGGINHIAVTTLSIDVGNEPNLLLFAAICLKT